MGTRHSIFIQQGGEYKLAKYGQWDGNPGGQGSLILEFLLGLNKTGWKAFRANAAKLGAMSKEDCEGVDKIENWATKFPWLSRDAGADILKYVMDGVCTKTVLDLEFVKDSLFCEWAYVIDFDKNTFEVYKGFRKTPLPKKERFYFDGYKSEPNYEYADRETKKNPPYFYYPVKHKKTFKLDKLPTYKEFLKLENCR